MKALDALNAPHDCYIILTSRCNLRCLHCYGSYGEPDFSQEELTGEEWGQVFDELVELGVFFVNIAGGEPTIHPDFPNIMRHIRKSGLHFILTTNGLCSDMARSAICESAELLIGLKISLDGPDADSHTKLRVGADMVGRPETFNRTLNTICYFKEQDVPFTIATCLHQHTIAKMPAFLELILRLRPVSWYISSIAPTGRAQKYPDVFTSDSFWPMSFWQDLLRICNEHQIFVRFIDMPLAQGYSESISAFECPAATWFCEINSDGTVAPCPLSRVGIPPELLRFDNIRTKSLTKIWNGAAFATFRGWRTQGCSGCKTADRCGRCVAQSLQWFRDPLKPPPFCVQRGELLALNDLLSLKQELASAIHNLSRRGQILT